MVTLNWADYLPDDSVAAAYGQLEGKQSQRAVSLHSSGGKKPCWAAWREEILVFADEDSDLVNHSIVHELIHAILMEESYWGFTWPDPKSRMRGALSNELQHPEVFRRMAAYNLDMTPYWRYWDLELRPGLASMMRDGADQLHYNFLQVFT
jgi:hypothetical protein